jgi:imidazolonepropionase-like amidohydrolase
VGSLEVGKDADIVVWSGHPFDYCSVVQRVLVDGKVVYEREEERE